MLTTAQGVAGAVFALDDGQVPIEALAQMIADLAVDPDQLAVLRARVPLAAKRFDPELMRDRYAEVYTSVCKPLAPQQAAE
jgi:hypothetical protein